jgi:hypothetical protein
MRVGSLSSQHRRLRQRDARSAPTEAKVKSVVEFALSVKVVQTRSTRRRDHVLIFILRQTF